MIERRAPCPVSGKVSFSSRQGAKAVARSEHYQDVNIFKCDDCGLFHIGGWWGRKDRAAHREQHGAASSAADMPISHAATFLRVPVDIVHRMITEGKVRGTHTHANTIDIHRIHTMILRTP